jgi:hypothetical protein
VKGKCVMVEARGFAPRSRALQTRAITGSA